MKYERVVIYPIHGASASNFRAALYQSGCKDDPLDADLLLDLLSEHRVHLRRVNPDTVETGKLQLLVEKRRRLVDDRMRRSNRNRRAEMFFTRRCCAGLMTCNRRWWADFLKRWPNLCSGPGLRRYVSFSPPPANGRLKVQHDLFLLLQNYCSLTFRLVHLSCLGESWPAGKKGQ
jgi:ribosomal protein S15P/S13E